MSPALPVSVPSAYVTQALEEDSKLLADSF